MWQCSDLAVVARVLVLTAAVSGGVWSAAVPGSLVVVTDALLLTGLAAALLFVVILLVEGALRPGYDPIYHTGSELELGARGWIQRTNFIVMSAGMFAFAAGVQRSLDSTIGPLLLAVFGSGLIIAGVFPPDPVRGYPPGAPIDRAAELSRGARIHDVAGPVMFLALLGAGIALAGQLRGGWRLYTILTAGIGFALTVWTVVAYRKDAANTGLVQRGLIVVYWSWIGALAIHLVADA